MGLLTSADDVDPNQQPAQDLHIENAFAWKRHYSTPFATAKCCPLFHTNIYFEYETCLVTPVGCDETSRDLRACSPCHGRCVVFVRIIDSYYPLHGNFRRCSNPCEVAYLATWIH